MSNLGELVLERLEELFPNDGARLLEYCLRGGQFPLGATHPALLGELADVDVDRTAFEDLTAAYAAATAYYFLLDAAIDGHVSESIQVADLTLLWTAASVLLFRATTQNAPGTEAAVQNACLLRVRQNAEAIREESAQQALPLEPDHGQDDRWTMVGRSSSSLLLYDILCLWSGSDPNPRVVGLIEEFIIAVQESDDLGDWREDFRAERWSPFLRRCLADLGRMPSEDELERFIYLGLGYERQAGAITRRLDKTVMELRRLSDVSSTGFEKAVLAQRDQMKNALTVWVATKLDARR